MGLSLEKQRDIFLRVIKLRTEWAQEASRDEEFQRLIRIRDGYVQQYVLCIQQIKARAK